MKKYFLRETLALMLFGTILLGTNIYGQNTWDKNIIDTLRIEPRSFPTDQEIMTPSPKASSIMRYGEHPVSLYGSQLK